MGLCKCAKKKVTNQFCFEHRVNVCEHCMVNDHPKCIVQSYLQWLNDSDYNPVCQLCQEDLELDECLRLVCYASNLVSPVADALREILGNYEWARAGLGMSILKSSAKYNSGHGNKSEDSSLLVGTHNNLQNDRGIPDGRDTTTAVPLLTEQYQNSHHQSSSQHRSSTLAASGKNKKSLGCFVYLYK
ncbi:Zinc finger protein-like 1-like protein [Armadillidium nasatum]|uniref:Zinc finger protein-like 1 homolog n=1 Tax=Armadillidium nasatum TaxID=96803 RepID=A0A5N5SZQ4_9CRUS|nr:Zinc finger protein-like 1-like protein [Armadillidium nasatum]